ncbi:MAG TPA: glycoside hydrolase family 2 TIM barrel-domain containing protein [bacterium]|nr:glycoside hydrolase family 2 TIM barrel-domain containing protein [bacterium]HPR86884.1 glycoside hydrolase family 2 TIM barrel-domain containing protein [bacterium]
MRWTCFILPFIPIVAVLAVALAPAQEVAGGWHQATPPLATRWSAAVGPDNARPEYPNPAMARTAWSPLNGLWQYAIRPRGADVPAAGEWAGDILVPYPLESALSGVQRAISETDRLWYSRTFTVPPEWRRQRILLHFEAVDWQTQVWINGVEVGSHEGGYDPFEFDITAALKSGEKQRLVVAVWDPTDTGTQPRGKQVLHPGGIFYTPCTGIWGSVWLEPVPETHIRELRLIPDAAQGAVTVRCLIEKPGPQDRLVVQATDGESAVASGEGAAGAALRLQIPAPRLWSPNAPHLYSLRIQLLRQNKVVDEVTSYVGLRSIAIGPDENGVTRLLLNGAPLFQAGPLDQGFWPDGIYTAPTEAAMIYDLEVLKRMGFNMLRKHVKVEPRRFYYQCDRLGLLVWQDMPSGDRSIEPGEPDITRTPESARQYYLELERMITTHFNHPSIVMWVPFNEGWGQFESAKVVEFIRGLDSTRLVNHASGWAERGVGDVVDWHRYPGPDAPQPEAKRAAVLGEFGGLGLPTAGHMWAEKNWGYQKMADREDLHRRYEELWKKVWELQEKPGLSAAVYTQTTDVETEANGLMTYDRAVIKQDTTRAPLIHSGRLSALPGVK